MRGKPYGASGKEGTSPREEKPRRGDVSGRFRTRPEAEMFAGYQALKWRLWPTTRGLRHSKECTARQTTTSLKGTTPWALPARNKAGRLRVDEGLESVETLRRHPNPGGGSSRGYVATRFLKRRRGTNRQGGSHPGSNPPMAARDDQTLEGGERPGEGSSGSFPLPVHPAQRRPQRPGKPRPERERRSQ